MVLTVQDFVKQRLKGYDTMRNNPGKPAQSWLSAYLHFGHISPIECVLTVRASKKASQSDKAAFVEELLVRRELAVNFVWYARDNYDKVSYLEVRNHSMCFSTYAAVMFTRLGDENAAKAR